MTSDIKTELADAKYRQQQSEGQQPGRIETLEFLEPVTSMCGSVQLRIQLQPQPYGANTPEITTITPQLAFGTEVEHRVGA